LLRRLVAVRGGVAAGGVVEEVGVGSLEAACLVRTRARGPNPSYDAALYDALERAGIVRPGPTGAKRSFHSFRHSFAKLALEGNRPLYWLSKYLGHSSYAVTDARYGHWEDEEKRKQAEELGKSFATALPGLY